MRAPGRPNHLVRRFFGSLRARRPVPEDQLVVAGLLTPAEAALFWAQPVADQSHGVASFRAVIRDQPSRRDLGRAALLHDVGKRHAGLGTMGRSIASALAFAHIAVSGRYAAYLDHGSLGAADLRHAGSDPLSIGFAADHHGARPDRIDPDDWAILVAADGE